MTTPEIPLPWTVDPDPSFFISEATLTEYATYADDPEGPPDSLASEVDAAQAAADRGWFTAGPPEW